MRAKGELPGEPTVVQASPRPGRRTRAAAANFPRPGRLAQLGERRLDKAEVTGSSPVTPTSPAERDDPRLGLTRVLVREEAEVGSAVHPEDLELLLTAPEPAALHDLELLAYTR